MKKSERVVRYLTEALNFKEVESASRKYRKFIAPVGPTGKKSENFYYIGKAGACRTGKSISNAWSISHIVDPKMEAWEIEQAKDLAERLMKPY